jgi:hypothetical protein
VVHGARSTEHGAWGFGLLAATSRDAGEPCWQDGEVSGVAQTELIDSLIATYRELNNKVRALPEERLASGGTGVRDLVRRLRDHELRFSQALKERITGIEMPDFGAGADAPVLGTESSNDSTAVLLSQFGTARESTLAMLRGLSAEEWQGASEGGRSIAASVQQLAEHDRRQMDQINSALGGS